MASLIPGFEYDIFISYRQKDNKWDCWGSKSVAFNKLSGEDLAGWDINLTGGNVASPPDIKFFNIKSLH